MRNLKVYIALAAFLVVVTTPIWYNVGKTLNIPQVSVAEAAGTQCVESETWMRAHHMELLNEWRDSVLRDREVYYTSKTTGKKFEMSLQNTCLKCHSNKEQFCDKCHETVGIKPYCWTCHFDPTNMGKKKDAPTSASTDYRLGLKKGVAK